MENLNCFSMKSAKEIEKWLKRRWWYEKFKENVENMNRGGKASAEILGGHYGDATVTGAFCWEFTPEGFHWWYRRNMQFLRWYLSNEPTIPKEEEVVISIGMFAGGMAFTTMIHHIAGGNWALAAANAACFVWLLFFSIKAINGR